jgi:hypothetical protein
MSSVVFLQVGKRRSRPQSVVIRSRLLPYVRTYVVRLNRRRQVPSLGFFVTTISPGTSGIFST